MSTNLIAELKALDPTRALDLPEVPAPIEPVELRLAPEPRRIRRRLLGVGAVATALAVLVALAVSHGGDSSFAAAAILRQQATLAARSPAIPADGFRYSKVKRSVLGTFASADPESADDESFSFRRPSTTESWIAADGSGRIKTDVEPIEWPGPRDKARWKASGSPRIPLGNQSSDMRFGPGKIDGRSSEYYLPVVQKLPADPDQLESIFRDEAAKTSRDVPEDEKVFEYAASVLMNPGAPPELRSALYELVSRLPDVGLEEHVVDPDGRTGAGVYIDSDYNDERNTLIFDPNTAQPLAHVETDLDPSEAIDSRLRSYEVLERSGEVASLKERP